ncbi:sialate O-acetylesterase [Arthrospiribacter ruber]|uniref:Sialate O-acetylesterase n=1 Tax=Arthrospiribacter ruber TaxID=2487934 RepID=A0A951IYA3_9BACT|nr:sialate O-acetylesterase [Arthrospiribacter ruber]MBW3469455.1 sialate O-acetylesterase [Arthrospiribacter ruber]
MLNRLCVLICLFVVFSCRQEERLSEVELPRFFSDHMVFQRGEPIRVWGKGEEGMFVEVKFNSQTQRAKVDENGKWLVEFDAMSASGPFDLEINEMKIRDVQVGEVWLASGQSNMEWVMSAGVEHLNTEISDADYPLIRFFKVPHDYDAKKKFNVRGGEWKVANSDNLLYFSAVAWFFAKRNHLDKGVPIGIIDASWGGTPAEGWIDAEALLQSEFYGTKAGDIINRSQYWEQEVIDNKLRELERNEVVGDARKAEIQGVVNPNYDDSDWESIKLPEANPLKDVVWLRKKVNLTDTQSVKIQFGEIEQLGHVYVNGGRLFVKDYSDKVREYPIPSSMLQKGENLIAIRVVNTWNNEVRVGQKGNFYLSTNQGKINLEGDWKFNNRIEDPLPNVEKYNWLPGMMFNAMIYPLVNYPIKGVIWYQGESNTGDHEHYEGLFSTLISSWRGNWAIGDFPFLFVQLANFMERKEVQPDSNWAFLREAQSNVRNLPNTGMAVTIDIGDEKDIHPRNKRDVGHRLYRVAQKVAYGDGILHRGPNLLRARVVNDVFVLNYADIGEGFVLESGDEVEGFIITGRDGEFYSAKGRITGENEIQVFHPKVTDPVEIRYAWADNPSVNLYNSEGLPAEPFRFRLLDIDSVRQ